MTAHVTLEPVVWVPNKGPHDYTNAERYGQVHFLTEGAIPRYQTDAVYAEIANGLATSQPNDYLLIASLSILNAIAAAVLAVKHGRINFLLHRDGDYVVRSIDMNLVLEGASDVSPD